MLAVALLKVASHPTPSPFSPTHRLGPAKIVSHGLSNSRYRRPQLRALLADFLQFREGMVQAVHKHSKGRYVMPIPSTTNTKPQHSSLTPTFSPCLITLPNMAKYGLKLLGCTSQRPSENGFSRSPLVSMTARTSTSQATARSPFLPSLRVTFVANSRSIHSLPSLMPGKQRMTRNWVPLPLNAVR